MSKKGGIDAIYSIVGSTFGPLCEREKGVEPPRYGKKEAKASQVSFSKRKMDNVEFPRRLIIDVEFPDETECPPKYEARRK